jgi:predicted AlkP superfamily phosphohydrolase/phosphomutase
MHQLETFDEGILASVFDSMDRVQHMFLRDRPDIVEGWYEKLDALVGRVEQRLAERDKTDVRLIIVSDHGFSDFDFKVHLNRWLIDRGYLVANGNGAADSLKHVDWAKSKAYAVGLNSLYVNLAGREGQGSVQPHEYLAVVKEIQDELLKWQGPNGQPVVQKPLSGEQAFSGPLASFGPDVFVGFGPGYRASSETGLGQWGKASVEPNADHWGADHCVDSLSVPGVLFCNQGLSDFAHPSYRDFPALAIGKALDSGASAPPPTLSSEDQEAVEERLRSLGYL